MKLISETHFLGVVQLRSIDRLKSDVGVALKTETRDGTECIFKLEEVSHNSDEGIVKISGIAYPEDWEFYDDGGNEPYSHTFRFSDGLFKEKSTQRLEHTA